MITLCNSGEQKCISGNTSQTPSGSGPAEHKLTETQETDLTR